MFGVAVSSLATCSHSYDCGSDMCCRGADGDVISDQEVGGFGPALFEGDRMNGTCSPKKAQKGEQCDSDCTCDTGIHNTRYRTEQNLFQ